MLKHDPQTVIDRSRVRKLTYRWEGPYRVRKAIPKKGTYLLEDFDGSVLPGTYAGNQLKKFIEREGFYEAANPNETEKEEGPEEEKNENEIEIDTQNDSIVGNGVAQDSEDKNDKPEYLPMDFDILLPDLDEEQRKEYMEYEE